ncbi:MAG: hypothetical protein A2167_06815 [Planctomycetes bacterium RBG_13_46_10]|nr:MAG: hypothetical protein A2167_06815 [Planctomycetes bacterium RBG_13_46_10]
MTINSYSSLCDDFCLDMYINTRLDLPTSRDTILTFFERIQKQFPLMSHFYRCETNTYCLEDNYDTGQERWITLEPNRVGSGVVNPLNLQDVFQQDKLVLELVPYMLGISHLDVDSLDLTFAMDFDYTGSHDEVIAEALFGSSAFNCFSDLPSAKPISFTPSMILALSEDECTQARISIESKTSPDFIGGYESKNKKQGIDDAISLCFTVRQYPQPGVRFDMLKSFEYQCRLAEELIAEKIGPNFILPLTEKIAQKRLI